MMTELKLHTYGEKLIVSEKVTIASGDINSAAIAVEFDECWDNYPARTAIFKNDKVTGNIEVLMVDNRCTIPAEVLQKNGTLKISIRAASLDGAALKTSTKVRYTIAEGASPGTTTLTPTMDLYQQYLAAMHEKLDPVQTALLEAFAEYKDALEEDYQAKMAAMMTMLQGDVLWENPSPESPYDGGTIEANLTEYCRFVVVAKEFYNEFIHKGIELRFASVCYDPTYWRNIKFTDTSITISQTDDDMAGNAIYNDRVIPIKIIGYKY